MGASGNNFFAQSFYANVDYITEVGAWLQEYTAAGQVRIAIVQDDGFGNPDENAVLWESNLIDPTTIGSWYTYSNLLIPVSIGTKYWLLVDGVNTGASGSSYAGTSSSYTDTYENLKYSNDGGVTWTADVA